MASLIERIKSIKEKLISKKNEVVQQKKVVYGNHGRLLIPSLKIDVPLYEGAKGTAQRIVDAKRSAAFIRWTNQNVIADHVSEENFCNLPKSVPGNTTAVIEYQNGTRENYFCVRIQTGYIQNENGINRLYDRDGIRVNTQNSGGLTIYTCQGTPKGNRQYVTLTYWRRM